MAYIKRKKRSVKWIHQAPGDDGELMSPPREPIMKPAGLKLVTGSRTETHSEQHELQHHLHQVTVAGQPLYSPEVKMNRGNDLQSPTGKGAELFAKRKKRMDQFIVDETSVQKSSMISQQQSSVVAQSSSTSVKQSSASGSSFLRSTCTAVQPTVDSAVHGTGSEGAPVYTAEVKVVQRASLPPTPSFEIPEDIPHHSIILEQLSEESNKEKRNSFNFAAKGWGTYNNFYTPITFAVK